MVDLTFLRSQREGNKIIFWISGYER